MALEVLDISANFKILVWKCWQEIRRRQISEKKNSSHRVTDVCFKFNSFIKKKKQQTKPKYKRKLKC